MDLQIGDAVYTYIRRRMLSVPWVLGGLPLLPITFLRIRYVRTQEEDSWLLDLRLARCGSIQIIIFGSHGA